MDAFTFINEFGWDEAERVARAAGTSVAYFGHLARTARRPSVKLADRLVEASEGRLDFVSLLKATKPTGRINARPKKVVREAICPRCSIAWKEPIDTQTEA